jgi:hypothetical protein
MINCLKALWIYLIVLVIFLIYRLYLKTIPGPIEENDFLNRNVFICPINGTMTSYWPISHFLFYVLLGFLFPECFLFLMLVGLVWEGIETIMQAYTTEIIPNRTNQNIEYTNWWSSNLRDITYNLAGYLVGASLAVMIRGNINPYDPGCMGFLSPP